MTRWTSTNSGPKAVASGRLLPTLVYTGTLVLDLGPALRGACFLSCLKRAKNIKEERKRSTNRTGEAMAGSAWYEPGVIPHKSIDEFVKATLSNNSSAKVAVIVVKLYESYPTLLCVTPMSVPAVFLVPECWSFQTCGRVWLLCNSDTELRWSFPR